MHKNYKKLPPFLTAALCAMLLCSCAPALRAPQPTTAAPYEEESSADYEQLTESSLKEQQRFADFEENLFQNEISASRLDLHFLLKNPEARGITETDALIAPISMEAFQQTRKDQEKLRNELSGFQTSLLTEDQKLTLRILESLMNTEKKGEGLELYSQPLAPTIGTQAQLPMLLCEYTFYTRQDAEDYLNILEYLDTFYGQILSFEQEKAKAGLMMSNTSIDHVIESCKSYLLVPGNNFMIDSFKERLRALPDLTEDAKKELCARNEAAGETLCSCIQAADRWSGKAEEHWHQRKGHVRISGWKNLLRVSCIHSYRDLVSHHRRADDGNGAGNFR